MEAIASGRFGALCGWIGVMIEVIRKFVLWEGVLGLCAKVIMALPKNEENRCS